jgi:hypothetical protein
MSKVHRPETTNRRAVLPSILAAGAIATVTAAGASASPVQSEALRIAIAAHRAAQAKVRRNGYTVGPAC